MQKPGTVEAYISKFPVHIQKILQELRTTIKQAAPGAQEVISYAMPAFTLGGRSLVYFAAYKNHIGLYPVPSGNKEFEKDFSSFKTSGKGTIQFPLDRPMPLDLVTKIVRFRVKENLKKAKK